MKVSIIMLTGAKQSGKDTCGEYLVSKGYVRFAFADVLKEQLASRYSLDLDVFYNNELKEVPCYISNTESCIQWTPRQLCNAEGALARSIDMGVWARYVAKQIKNKVQIRDGCMRVVITDCRYQNEIDIICPTSVIRIVRPGYEPQQEPDQYSNIDRVDVTICNDSSKAQLWSQLDEYVI
jgi:hypothetical protein